MRNKSPYAAARKSILYCVYRDAPAGTSLEEIVRKASEIFGAPPLTSDCGGLGIPTEGGWYVDDGNAEAYYGSAASGAAAARKYVDDGDWGDRDTTIWIRVTAWRAGVTIDSYGDVIDCRLDEGSYTIALDPEEPECTAPR